MELKVLMCLEQKPDIILFNIMDFPKLRWIVSCKE